MKLFLTSTDKLNKHLANNQFSKTIRTLLIIALALGLTPLSITRVSAAALTTMSDTLSTIKQSVLADHEIQFITSSGVALNQTITVTFPAGFALGTFSVNNEDLAFSAAGTCASFTEQTLAASATTTSWGVSQASQVMTFTAPSSSNNVPANRCVRIRIGANATTGAAGASIITNQTAAQNNTDPKIVLGGTMADSGTFAVEIVTNNDVSVTGTVDPTITCSISANSAAFGTLTVGSIMTAGTTPVWTISTNGDNGYSLTVKSAGNGTNAGLYSAGANYVIKSADSAENSTADLSVAATIGYGLQGTKTDGDAGSATTTVAAPYTSTSNTVGRLQLTMQTLASATGPVSNATITSTLKTKATGLVPAGSYVDTLSYVCTGIF